jgi:MFS family permease
VIDRAGAVEVVPALRSSPGWWLLGATVVAQAGFSALEQGVPLLVGFIRVDLDVSAAAAGVAVSSFVFGKILGSYVTGWAADRVGERSVLVFGGVVGAALVVVATRLPDEFLFALLVLAGIGNSAATPAGGRLVVLAFSPDRFGLVQGIRQMGVPLGGLLAAATLPWAAEAWGWRSALIVAAGLTMLAVVPLALPATGRRRALLEDLRSATPAPAGDRRAVVLLTLWAVLLVPGQFTVVAFLAPDLHERTGLSLAASAVIVAGALAAGAIGRVVWGVVSDRRLADGRWRVMALLTGLDIVAALCLFAIPASAPLAVFALAAVFAGATLIGHQGVWYAMLAEASGRNRIGAASGFAATFVLMGTVVDIAGTHRAVWLVLAAVIALAFVPAYALTTPTSEGP